MRQTIWGGILLGGVLLGSATGSEIAQVQERLPASLRSQTWHVAAPPKRERERDQLEYLFLASDRPVRMRVHLQIGEKPYDWEWDRWMNRLFEWFDKNGDGVLAGNEPGRLPQAQTLMLHLQGSIGGGTTAAVPLATLDTDKDGKVSKEEFKSYYSKGGVGPLRFFFDNSPANSAQAINEAIYRRLDRDGNGKLSQEEVALLPQLIRSLDENEDELLTAQELNLNTNQGLYGFVAVAPGVRRPSGLPPEQGLLEIKEETKGSELVPQLISRYDRNKDGKVAREEIGLSAKEFDALDANKDGVLTGPEMAVLVQRQPDLVFRVRVGQLNVVSGFLSRIGLGGGVTPDRAEIYNPSKRAMPLTQKVQRVNGETLLLTLGDARIQLQGVQGQNFRNAGVRSFYLQQFDAIAGKNDYITREQEKENRQNPFVFQIFNQADKDGDGKLHKKELNTWFDVIDAGMGCHVTLQVVDQGRGVFELLDGNGDSQLSLREMRSAWTRIKPLCKNAGGLAVTDLPRMMRISAGQGNVITQPAVFFPGGQMGVATPVHSAGAPVWFRKMDRNNDGDLSPKEWLGTEEDFRALDRDGDGLISVEEARQKESKTAKAR